MSKRKIEWTYEDEEAYEMYARRYRRLPVNQTMSANVNVALGSSRRVPRRLTRDAKSSVGKN